MLKLVDVHMYEYVHLRSSQSSRIGIYVVCEQPLEIFIFTRFHICNAKNSNWNIFLVAPAAIFFDTRCEQSCGRSKYKSFQHKRATFTSKLAVLRCVRVTEGN